MGGGVREFLSRFEALGAFRRLSSVVLAIVALIWFGSIPALAQGSLQDLVGTYSVTEKDVEGDLCALGTVQTDAANMTRFDVTYIDESSIGISMNGGEAFRVPFDSSARTFRIDSETEGYKAVVTGQLVRGRDSVALAMVWNWGDSDCVASLTGSKSAPDIGFEGGELAANDDDWGWLENPAVLAMIALLMALTAAGVAFNRQPEPDPEPEPEPTPDRWGDKLIAPEDAYEEPIAPPPKMPVKVWEDLSGVPQSWLFGPWQWHDGSRVSLFKGDSDHSGPVHSTNGRSGTWSLRQDGSINVVWRPVAGDHGPGGRDNRRVVTMEKLRPSKASKALIGEAWESAPRADGHMSHEGNRKVKHGKLAAVK